MIRNSKQTEAERIGNTLEQEKATCAALREVRDAYPYVQGALFSALDPGTCTVCPEGKYTIPFFFGCVDDSACMVGDYHTEQGCKRCPASANSAAETVGTIVFLLALGAAMWKLKERIERKHPKLAAAIGEKLPEVMKLLTGLFQILGAFTTVLYRVPWPGAFRAITSFTSVLAVLSEERLPGKFSDIPTAREQGIDAIGPNWRGFYMPADIQEIKLYGAAKDSPIRFEQTAQSPTQNSETK